MTDDAQDETTVQDGETEARSPEEIRAEIEQTREALGETVEALAEKTDVKAQAQERIGVAKETVAENLGAAKDAVTGKTEEFVARTKQAAPDSAQDGVQQIGSTVQERPLPFATAAAFAAGLLIGWLVGRG